MRVPIVAAVALGLSLAARIASAQPYEVPASAIAWRAPAECGDGAALRHRVEGYLDHAIGAGLLAAVEVVQGDDGAYRARLQIHGAGGVAERAVEAPDCAQVVDAVALVLGLAAAQAPPVVVAPPPDERGEIDRRTAAPPPPRNLSLRLSGVGDLGAIPGGGVGLGGALVFARDRFALVVSGAWLPARFAALDTNHRAGVEVGLDALAAEACVRVVEVWVCVGGGGGVMTGEGVEVPGGYSNRSTWAEVIAAVALEQRVSDRVRFVAELQGDTAVVRSRFVLPASKDSPMVTVLYEPSLIGARLWTGFEISLF